MTSKELLEDLLIEFDELGMEPTTIVPDPSERAIRWKRELLYAIEHWGAEVAREILQEARQAVLSLVLANAMGENFDLEKRFSEIEKKYTEADPEPPKGE